MDDSSVTKEELERNDHDASREESHEDHSLPANLNARLTFLGTGSAIPSKYRNVTGNLLQFPSLTASTSSAEGNEAASKYLMLDCGEGSLGQLCRVVNGDRTRLRTLLQNLQCVWISHNHADHHLGLLRLLSFRAHDVEKAHLEPMLVIAPTPIMYWLLEYAALDPTVAGTYSFVDNAAFDPDDKRYEGLAATATSTRSWLAESLQITEFTCVPVKHTHLSYALVFTWKQELKLAFSGDCRPSELLAEKARDAFLLLHEATLEDAMQAEAKAKKHSTTAEALQVGKDANVKHLILTHFSQRYPKVPALDENQDCLCAMDLLSIEFADLGKQAEWMEVGLQFVAQHELEEDDDE